MRSLAGCRKEHFRRRDHLPATRVVFSAPELVETEAVEMGGEVEVALELKDGIFSHGVMGGEERPESDSLRPSPRRALKCHGPQSMSQDSIRPDRSTVNERP